MTAEGYQHAGKLPRGQGAAQGLADEGGWGPVFSHNDEAMDVMVAAINAAGFVPDSHGGIALDVAAPESGKEGQYSLGFERVELDSDRLMASRPRIRGCVPFAKVNSISPSSAKNIRFY